MCGPCCIHTGSESSQYSRQEVRALQRQVRSAARSCRDQKQREANAGLNPRQCLVLLAVYILSRFDVLVAAEFLDAKSDCQAMPKDELEQFIEELYFRTDMEVLSRLQEPVKRSVVSVRREAVSFVARSKANAFVQKMNIERGVAPTSLSTADQYLRQCERLGEPNLNRQLRDCVERPRNTGCGQRRNLRRLCHRFRCRWSLKYRSLRPLEKSSQPTKSSPRHLGLRHSMCQFECGSWGLLVLLMGNFLPLEFRMHNIF